MGRIVNDEALDTLFRAARSPAAWLPRPVGDTLLRALSAMATTRRRHRPKCARSLTARARSCDVGGPMTAISGDPTAPLLLAIETAGSRCSAAVARGERVLAAESLVLRHGHAEALLP